MDDLNVSNRSFTLPDNHTLSINGSSVLPVVSVPYNRSEAAAAGANNNGVHSHNGREYSTDMHWGMFNWMVDLPAFAHQTTVFAVIAGVVTLIGTVTVLARLWIRFFKLKFFVDDWLILLALIIGLCSGVCFEVAVVGLLRFFRWAVPRGKFVLSLSHEVPGNASASNLFIKGSTLHYLFVGIQSALARISIMWTFLRLSAAREVRNVRLFIKISIVIMVLACIATTWLVITPCWPATYLFDRPDTVKCLFEEPGGGDFLFRAILMASVVNALTDSFTFALPFIVFRLAFISKQKKRELYALFAFGFFVFLTSLGSGIKAILINYELHKTNSANSWWAISQLFAIGEANAVMVGACLPVLAKPVREWYQGWRRRTKRVSAEVQAEMSNTDISQAASYQKQPLES